MKSFSEFCKAQEQLNEGLVRTGAIATFAAKARADGQRSETAFKRGMAKLSKRKPDDSMETRQERMEGALGELFAGLIHLHKQIGSGGAVNVAGHLLRSKALTKRARAGRRR